MKIDALTNQMRFFARTDWLFTIIRLLSASLGAGVVCAYVFVVESHEYAIQQPMWFSSCILGASIIGWVFTWPIVSIMFLPLIRLREKINGAPFQQDEAVIVISNKSFGTTGKIYEIWKERHQVRIDLGLEAGEKAEDVFSYLEIVSLRKLSNAEK